MPLTEHSTDNHDYMATTLTPGVHRMPSVDEMALMQQLVAQAKGDAFGVQRQDAAFVSDGSVVPLHSTPQYEAVANATFTNLNTSAGWNTQGSATFNPDSTDPSTGSGRTASVTLN